MQKIIGGIKGWQGDGDYVCPDAIKFVNTRSALYYLSKQFNATLWLPSYICESILDIPCPIAIYEVDKALKAKPFNVKAGDLVLIPNYWGFPCDELLIEKCKEAGALTIQDSCHSIFTKDEKLNFRVFSFGKNMGVADGALLFDRDKALNQQQLQDPPNDFIVLAHKARTLRTMFDQGENNEWYNVFLESKKIAPIGNYSMSKISERGLHNIDITKCKKNFNTYLQHLEEISFYKFLPEDVVPYGFPILIENRDNMQKQLIKEKIYCPVHWRIQKIPKHCKESYFLADRMMTLPCDDRYDEDDLMRVISLCKHFEQHPARLK